MHEDKRFLTNNPMDSTVLQYFVGEHLLEVFISGQDGTVEIGNSSEHSEEFFKKIDSLIDFLVEVRDVASTEHNQ